MKNVYLLAVGGAVMALSGVTSAQGQVARAEVREAVLAKVERLQVLTAGDMPGHYRYVSDPFYALEAVGQGEQREAAVPSGVNATPQLSDDEILRRLAEQVRPSGVMSFGNDTHLLFGERRVRSGDVLSIQYQGHNYSLVVERIEPRSFILRLNEEIISKPIQ